MMNAFVCVEKTAERPFHDKDVFEDVSTSACPRMIMYSHHDVASLLI
jgi:hypothetical protein